MPGFARHQRLLRPAQFQRVFADATRAGDQFVTVLARPNGLPHARLGLAVGRRKITRAARRNTFKRIVRESFRVHQQRLSGLDVVVIAKPAAAAIDRSRLRASIDRQWGILDRKRIAR